MVERLDILEIVIVFKNIDKQKNTLAIARVFFYKAFLIFYESYFINNLFMGFKIKSYPLNASVTPLCKILPALMFNPLAKAGFSAQAISHPLLAIEMA